MREILTKVIEYLCLCAVIAFVCGFMCAWAFLACFIFGALAMVVAIIRQAY